MRKTYKNVAVENDGESENKFLVKIFGWIAHSTKENPKELSSKIHRSERKTIKIKNKRNFAKNLAKKYVS